MDDGDEMREARPSMKQWMKGQGQRIDSAIMV